MSKLYDLLNTLIGKVNKSVKTDAQTLTDAEKMQARTNIAALSADDVAWLATVTVEDLVFRSTDHTGGYGWLALEAADDGNVFTPTGNLTYETLKQNNVTEVSMGIILYGSSHDLNDSAGRMRPVKERSYLIPGDASESPGYTIGNESLVWTDGEDTGEPFVIWVGEKELRIWVAEGYDGNCIYSGHIYLTTYNKMPEEFLPDISVVRFTEQTLTDEQKAQARVNIGAATVQEVIDALPVYAGEVEDA